MEVLPTTHDINHVIKIGNVKPTVEIAKDLEILKKERVEVKNLLLIYIAYCFFFLNLDNLKKYLSDL